MAYDQIKSRLGKEGKKNNNSGLGLCGTSAGLVVGGLGRDSLWINWNLSQDLIRRSYVSTHLWHANETIRPEKYLFLFRSSLSAKHTKLAEINIKVSNIRRITRVLLSFKFKSTFKIHFLLERGIEKKQKSYFPSVFNSGEFLVCSESSISCVNLSWISKLYTYICRCTIRYHLVHRSSFSPPYCEGLFHF